MPLLTTRACDEGQHQNCRSKVCTCSCHYGVKDPEPMPKSNKDFAQEIVHETLLGFGSWAGSKGIFPAKLIHTSLDEEFSWTELIDMFEAERFNRG